MKIIKRIMITTLLFVLLVSSADVLLPGNPAIVQAATIKISKKTLTLEVGESATLTVKGASKKITWYTSNKKVAAVSVKGKVTAKTAGKATITAKTAGKKLTCAVTVEEPVSPIIKDAPFQAEEKQLGNFRFVIPSGWILTQKEDTDTSLSAVLTPSVSPLTPAEATLTSDILIQIDYETAIPDYKELKADTSAAYTEENLMLGLQTYYTDVPFEFTDYRQSELTSSFGNVLKTEYTLKLENKSVKQCIYHFIMDHYVIAVIANDRDYLDLDKITEYIISSMTLIKS